MFCMDLKKNGFEIELSAEEIKPFEEKMLFSGLCDFIIPMRFSNTEKGKKVTYDCSGYTSLRDLNLKSAKEVFEILEKTILTLNKSVDFFIPHEKVSINKDTVYYNLKKKHVRIAYIPSKTGTLTENLNAFIDELTEEVDEAAGEYLQCIRKDLNYYNRNLKDMAGFVSEQRKRIYQCGIL